ncbi:hypothetical protein [Marinisporobacter balticus]|uniref:Uncharacterized protein n=1 Tax=Marinisporobacter balticus TaxID=2018667 RepID=A0A4R2KM11_9FIRM|nr:hypothetical protein [Marinisporobacter balticus]TCO71068.1 hypothetical protein EV214_12359 [Marinisporobacter balticus]
MIENIIKDLKEYFSKSSIYLDMNSTDENKIRLGCSKTRVHMNLYWEDIFYLIDEENRFGDIKSAIQSKGVINKMGLIESLFGYLSYEGLYSYNNKKLKLWNYKLNSFKDRYIEGFYKDNYAEFSIQPTVNVSIEELICNFQIENVEINIAYPSDIYRLIFQGIKPLTTFRIEWDNDITISLRKNDKSKLKLEEVEKYLQQALFILNIYYPQVFIFGSSNNDYMEHNINYKQKFAGQIVESKHIEPIIYYNEGINSTKETAFYYFYKVLEYYFDIIYNVLMI